MVRWVLGLVLSVFRVCTRIKVHLWPKAPLVAYYGTFGSTLHEVLVETRRKLNSSEAFVFYPRHQDDVYLEKRVIGLPGVNMVGTVTKVLPW